MNRRASTNGRKKPARKKKPAQKRAVEKKTAPKRPARKNAVAKKASRRKAAAERPTRRSAAKKVAREQLTRRARSSGRSQNRRRPSAKKPPHGKPRRTWSERAARAREGLGEWLLARRAWLRRGGQLALGGLLVTAALWLGDQTVRYAQQAEAFAIREIVIDGNVQLEDIDVRRAARLQIGSNVFEISAENARNHLLQHPWIAEATVIRKLPGRVRIEIVERKPVALVALDQLRSEAHAFAREIAISAPLAVRSIRTTLRGDLADQLRTATAHEAAEQAWLRETADFAEGTRAMAERRQPDFKGV
mgnify:CR=1 FL=1